MKENSVAHFDLVKMQNRKMIRNLLRKQSPQSISSLANLSGLSYPTVSGLLKELVNSKEVLPTEDATSNGGRPGMRYELNGAYQYALVMYFEEYSLQGVVYDAYGKAIERKAWVVTEWMGAVDLINMIGEVKGQYSSLSIVSLGVPGIVDHSRIRQLPTFPYLEEVELGELIKDKFQIATFIENDVNAMAFGEAEEWRDFAHIAYVNQCIGVGIVLKGEVYNGSHGFAGELELLCENLADKEASLAKSILVLSCVLDLPDVLLSGVECTEQTVESVKQILSKSLGEKMMPNLHLIEDMKATYERGLLRRILLKWSEEV